MLKFEDISYGFPKKDLYNHIYFNIELGEHAALIGSNGVGKSTLIDMIVSPDKYMYEGRIILEEGTRIGFARQFVKHETEEITAFEYLARPFLELLQSADNICEEMETAENMEELCEKYQKTLDEIEAVDGYSYEINIKKQLALAGLTELENAPINKISGGEYKLLTIIRNMLLKPQLLIMDEPDVFLDFENIVGLIRLINNHQGTILAVTHNRLLLSQCFDKILHLENEELQEYPGSFAEYEQSMLETKIEMLEQATKDSDFIEVQEKLVEQLRKSATVISSPTKGKQLKARVSYLERLQARRVKNPFIEEHDYDFYFLDTIEGEEGPDIAISVKDYSLEFDRKLLDKVSFDIMKGETVAIVGANGTGKSSMLRDIYEMSDKEKSGYFSQVYDDDSEQLSGGERNIRQLYSLAKSRTEILFLDEPTSHLDTYAQIALENALLAYKGTVLMVSHDFVTIANCADRIFILENGSLREMSGRSYRKSVYKKYFGSDIFEQERIRKETAIRINELLKQGKYSEARKVLENLTAERL